MGGGGGNPFQSLTSFFDALVTFVSESYVTSIATNVKHTVRTTGSEHQGQTISDPDQNLEFTCIFSSGMQEYSLHIV